jgi:hypothetical protein
MNDDGSMLRMMSAGQQSDACCPPAAWCLRSGEVRRLRITRGGPRWLRVGQGGLWLPRSGSLDDHWLLKDDAIRLERGADVVVEAAGDTWFDMLEAPQQQTEPRQALALHRFRAWFRGLASTPRRPTLTADLAC